MRDPECNADSYRYLNGDSYGHGNGDSYGKPFGYGHGDSDRDGLTNRNPSDPPGV